MNISFLTLSSQMNLYNSVGVLKVPFFLCHYNFFTLNIFQLKNIKKRNPVYKKTNLVTIAMAICFNEFYFLAVCFKARLVMPHFVKSQLGNRSVGSLKGALRFISYNDCPRSRIFTR